MMVTIGLAQICRLRKGMVISMDRIPRDPVMLLSFINLKLRDFYANLDALCDELELDCNELVEKLAGIDYHYDEERNQFV